MSRSAPMPPPSLRAPADSACVPYARRDLLSVAELTRNELVALLAATERYVPVAHDPRTRTGDLADHAVALLFFEPSTRTRLSFALAAQRLGADAVDLSAGVSSLSKGEALTDTARVIEAMGVSAMVVRSREAGVPAAIARAVACPVLNAGDGRHEHPTQALTDLYTIAEACGRRADFDLSGLTVAIVGDCINSRVARSVIAGVRLLGGHVACVGPPDLVPPAMAALGCDVLHDLDAVLPSADVVMMLRLQLERHDTEGVSEPGRSAASGDRDRSAWPARFPDSLREYRHGWALTVERARRLRPGAIVMHPGPVNRGVEIDGEVADGPRSVILQQVRNGLAARMAALALCCRAARDS